MVWFQLSYVVTTAGPDKTSSGSLARLHYAATMEVRMISLTPIQGHVVIHISAWSSIPDRHPFLEKGCLLVEHTHVYQVIFNNRATDWRFSIAIISRTGDLFIPFLDCYRLMREVTEPLCRKHEAASCGKRLVKFSCGLPLLNVLN
jgi:hypothetical protein